MASAPGGILFDAYGTIFDVHSIGALAESLFPAQGRTLAALWRDKQIEYTRLRTLSGRYSDFFAVTGDALRHACDRLGLGLSDDQAHRLLDQYLRLDAFPDVLPVLEGLHARGMRLAILSNGTPHMLDAALAAAGMTRLFDHVLSADSVRKFKTAPEVYQLGVDAFQRPAAELLFVSSNGWDACCATWFGYRTFWVNRAADPPERLGIVPSAEGRGMADLGRFAL
jgi:2-haloacid dehalogenase